MSEKSNCRDLAERAAEISFTGRCLRALRTGLEQLIVRLAVWGVIPAPTAFFLIEWMGARDA